MENLYLAGFIQALFFCSLIIIKKNKQLKDYLLVLFILILGTNLLAIYSFATGLYKEYSIFIYLDIYYWALLGPVLLIYTSVLISGKNKIGKIYWSALIPPLIITISFSEYIFGDVQAFFSGLNNPSLLIKTGKFVWLYNSIVFYLISLVLIRKHKNNLESYYSYSRNVDLNWLRLLNHGFGLFLFFLLARPLLNDLLGIVIPFNYNSASWLVMVIYIFGIGHFGYRQKDLFSDPIIPQPLERKEFSENQARQNSSEPKISYFHSGLSPEESRQIINRIENLLDKEKAYLDSELDLPKLAKMANTSTHKISQVINDRLNKNFFELINDYRIRDVKAKLLDPGNNHYNILSLAFESGFNSKSSFYNLFKKYENLTPAQFREKQLQKVV